MSSKITNPLCIVLLVAIEAIGVVDKSLFKLVPYVGEFLPQLPVLLGIFILNLTKSRTNPHVN